MNVQTDSGSTSYVCLNPTQPVALLKHPLYQQDLSWGPGYPALQAPACPSCGQPMTLPQNAADPGGKVKTKEAYLASLQVDVNVPQP